MDPGSQFHQLPMFMSAREIQTSHHAWNGDRQLFGVTERNERNAQGQRRSPVETDDELFSRKAAESHQRKIGSTRIKEQSLYEHVVENGVSKPVHLQDPTLKMFGDSRPSILGGHHRIAVMAEAKPDNLMPVLFAKDMKEAKGSKGNKYS